MASKHPQYAKYIGRAGLMLMLSAATMVVIARSKGIPFGFAPAASLPAGTSLLSTSPENSKTSVMLPISIAQEDMIFLEQFLYQVKKGDSL
jgi:hypothetical protein